MDPELGINVVDLGLIYRVETGPEGFEVDFTLTYPGCPLGEIIERDIVRVLSTAFDLPAERVRARLVWQPFWGPERMSEEARVSMGYPI